MLKLLRRHWLATLLTAALLIGFGGWAVFLQDPDDLSDTSMFLAFAGFFAWCAGLAAIAVLIFRPIQLTRDEAATLEVTLVQGKWRFVTRFLLIASAFLIGTTASIWQTNDITTVLLAAGLFLGVTLLVADALWKHFQVEHAMVAKEETQQKKTRPPGLYEAKLVSHGVTETKSGTKVPRRG